MHPSDQSQQNGQRNECVEGERNQDNDREHGQRTRGFVARLGDHGRNEAENADRRELHDPLGHAHHDVEHRIPESIQRPRILVVQARHEIAEQNREEDDAEHLPFDRGLKNVRRYHALKNLRDVAQTAAGDGLLELGRRRVERKQVLGRLAVDVAGTDRIDDDQANQDRRQGRRPIEQQRLATERAEVSSGTDTCNADDNRRCDQGHDDHFQRVQKQRADVVENGDVPDAEYGRVDAGLGLRIEDVTASQSSDDNGNQNLPMQLEFEHGNSLSGRITPNRDRILPANRAEIPRTRPLVVLVSGRAYCKKSEAANKSRLISMSASACR